MSKRVRMPDPACHAKILAVLRKDRTALGPKLGQAAYTARVPAAVVASLTGVAEQTVYRWFYGCEPRRNVRIKIKAITDILEHAVERHILPVVGDYETVLEAITLSANHLKEQRRTKSVEV